MKTSNEKLSEKVFGQTFTVPNLYYFFPDWNCDVNPHYEALCIWFEKYWLQRWVEDLEIQRALRKTCVPFFVSCIYPRIEYEQLRAMAGLFGWFFFWDDLIDCGPLTNDIQGTEILCADTIKLMKRCLGTTEPTKMPPPAVAPIQCFGTSERVSGTGVLPMQEHDSYTSARSGSELRESRNESENVSMSLRMGDTRNADKSTLDVESRQCSARRYACGLNIPSRMFANRNLEIILYETAKMVWLINDLISMKKEFVQHQFESIVPILMFHGDITSTEAVNEAGKMLTDSYDLFRQTESILYNECPLDCLGDIREFVHNFKDLVVATMHWSYECTRYMKSGDVDGEKRVTFTVTDRA